MRVVGYLIVRNEGSVLEEVINHHRNQGLEMVVIDNGSTDNSPVILERLVANGQVLGVETHQTLTYEWHSLIRAAIALASRFNPDWIVHVDANTFLESGIIGQRLIDDISIANRENYNVLTLRVFDFYPTPADDPREKNVYTRVRYYTPRALLSTQQEKIFRAVKGLVSTDGHSVKFPPGIEKRVSPKPSVMRHYVFRSPEEGTEKLLQRKNRWDEQERKLGSHVHYDGYLGYSSEAEIPIHRLHRKDEVSQWIDEVTHTRPPALVSETYALNRKGRFDNQCKENAHLCFILGCQRSGTTLLRLIFGSNPDVTVFEEPRSYDYWADPGLRAKTVEAGQAKGTKLFVFKTPCLTEQFDRHDHTAHELRYNRFPFRFSYNGELLVFLVRDPRDVCLSLKQLKADSSGNDWIDHWPRYVEELYPSIIPDFHVRYARELVILSRAGKYRYAALAALYWKIKTEAFFRYDALGYKLRLVLYEDLVTMPERTLRELCRFLRLKFDPAMLRHHEQDHLQTAQGGLTVGRTDTRRPIDSEAIRLYSGTMPIEEQRVILEIAGPTYKQIQRKWEQQLYRDTLP